MFSRNSLRILQKCRFAGPGRSSWMSTVTPSAELDPAPLFFNEQIQNLLKTLTHPDPKRVFRPRMDGHKMTDPEYKFMTDEELDEALKEAHVRMEKRLQMPPVVKEREPITQVLSKDPALQGHEECKFVFTDISYGVSDVNRLIVVRDPDGSLRKANWDERFRMNQIYFPTEGREMFTPKMFEDEHLQAILDRQDYEFILDRACIQFEPDDPAYHRITKSVYTAVDSAAAYDKLRSTKHYGPFVFHLALSKSIDNLLHENITREFIEDAALLIKLYYKIHPPSSDPPKDPLELISTYLQNDSSAKGRVVSALNAYKELSAAREVTAQGIRKAHGLD